MVPKSATDRFSVLDVALNKPIKSILRNKFSDFCTCQIVEQLRKGVVPGNVMLNTNASLIKPLIAKWAIEVYDEVKKNEKEFISGGWRKVSENIEQILNK